MCNLVIDATALCAHYKDAHGFDYCIDCACIFTNSEKFAKHKLSCGSDQSVSAVTEYELLDKLKGDPSRFWCFCSKSFASKGRLSEHQSKSVDALCKGRNCECGKQFKSLNFYSKHECKSKANPTKAPSGRNKSVVPSNTKVRRSKQAKRDENCASTASVSFSQFVFFGVNETIFQNEMFFILQAGG